MEIEKKKYIQPNNIQPNVKIRKNPLVGMSMFK